MLPIITNFQTSFGPPSYHKYNGVDQYSYYADNGVLDVNQASVDFCLCGWAKANNSNNIEGCFGKSAGVDGAYWFQKTSANVITFMTRSSSGLVGVSTGIDGDSDIDYHHILARINITGSLVYVYTDGVLQNPGGTSVGTFATLDNGYEFVVGAENTSTTTIERYANTSIRDIRIFHADVTSAANLALLQQGKSIGNEIAWWPMGVQGIRDKIGNKHLINVNNPLIEIDN